MEDARRPVTPPPRALDSNASQLTPEQIKRIEINRLKGRRPYTFRLRS